MPAWRAASRGLDRAEEAALLAEADRQLARVGLADDRYRKAGDLALGQIRILEIARALALDPDAAAAR
jgi:ABC-type branched-subunit amino acid transport system ATPase component